MNRTYVANGQQVVLEVDPSQVAVRFREPAPQSMRAAVSAQYGLGPFAARFEVPREKFTLLPTAGAASAAPDHSLPAGTAAAPHAAGHDAADVEASVQALNAAPEVERATPVFRHGELRVVATERVIVGFRAEAADPRALLQQQGFAVIDTFPNSTYVVRIGAAEDPFDVSDRLRARADVRFAEPDLVTVGRHVAPSPASADGAPGAGAGGPGPAGGDPLAARQWALRTTQADQALAIVTGSPDVRIAVLDDGVDAEHEDLRGAVVGRYDATDDDAFQEPNPWDGHGTACAGIAAAQGGNGLGVRGVAAGCSLLAVRIAYSEAPRSDWVTSSAWIARGIDWAWKQGGASVLSNSWGGGAPSSLVTDAIDRAIRHGRAGLGAVVVMAVGNSDSAVMFPATHPDVLAVAASNQQDEPKTRSSADGETWWGSCHGPEVDLAAPGVRQFTTDISGERGYNPAPGNAGNYFDRFNGTSSATPLVAGAAALVLSAAPQLPEAQVRAILRTTADRVGAFPYHGGRNDRMGYGRLNVLRAVTAARNVGPGVSAPPGVTVSPIAAALPTLPVTGD